jgi:addiction module HigA family antidote
VQAYLPAIAAKKGMQLSESVNDLLKREIGIIEAVKELSAQNYMQNPPHPGAFIQEVYLTPNEMSCKGLALKLGVAASTLHRVLNETGGVSPEMALCLAKALGCSPES